MRLANGRHCSYFSQPDPLSSATALVVAGLDVNVRSVRAALIQLDMNDVRIISQAEVVFPKGIEPGDSSSSVIFQSSCRRALKMVQEGHPASPQSVAVSLSGDLIKGVTQKIEVKRPEPRRPLSSKEIDGLLLKNQTAALKQAAAELQLENPDLEIDLKLLNSSFISFMIDGRVVANPLNHQAAEVSIRLYNVFIPDNWLAFIQKATESLDLNLIALAYKPFALTRGLSGDQTNADLNALIINIEDEMTDVGLIRSGTLICSKNFSLGWRAFERALGRGLDLDQTIVIGLKNEEGDFNFSSLDKEMRPRAEKILNHTAYVWLQGLILILKDFRADEESAKVYFSGSGAGFKILQTAVRKVAGDSMLGLNQEVEISVLGLSKLVQSDTTLKFRDEFSLATLAGLGRLAGDILNVIQKPTTDSEVRSVN